jgi:hypothetical protein
MRWATAKAPMRAEALGARRLRPARVHLPEELPWTLVALSVATEVMSVARWPPWREPAWSQRSRMESVPRSASDRRQHMPLRRDNTARSRYAILAHSSLSILAICPRHTANPTPNAVKDSSFT